MRLVRERIKKRFSAGRRAKRVPCGQHHATGFDSRKHSSARLNPRECGYLSCCLFVEAIEARPAMSVRRCALVARGPALKRGFLAFPGRTASRRALPTQVGSFHPNTTRTTTTPRASTRTPHPYGPRPGASTRTPPAPFPNSEENRGMRQGSSGKHKERVGNRLRDPRPCVSYRHCALPIAFPTFQRLDQSPRATRTQSQSFPCPCCHEL